MKKNTSRKCARVKPIMWWMIYAASMIFECLIPGMQGMSVKTKYVFIIILMIIGIVSMICGVVSLCSKEKIKSDTLEQTTVQPEPADVPSSPDSDNGLSREIIECIEKEPTGEYMLKSLLWQDAVDCFPDERIKWDGAFFMLDLNRRKIYVNLSTYPNPISREENRDLTPEEFHQIAERFNFEQSLRSLKTEEDLNALFDNSLKNAVASAQCKLSLEKAKRMKENATQIPEHFYKSPALNITEFNLMFFQRYAKTYISMKQEDRKYALSYRSEDIYGSSINDCQRILTDPEASWLEAQIDAALKNTNTDTWKSLPGGDWMSITVKNGDTIIEDHSGCPLKKYMDLLHDTEKLAKYGSNVKTPRVKDEFAVKKKGQFRGTDHGWLEEFVFYKYSNKTVALFYQVGWNEGSHNGGAGSTVIIPDEWLRLTWDEFLDRFCEKYSYADFSYDRDELDSMPELKRFLGFE